MQDLAMVTSISEVKSAVLCDLEGAFLDAFNEPEGEAVAAVMGYVAVTLQAAGETLGLGALRRVSLASPRHSSVVLVDGGSVISAVIEPTSALAAVEKALDAASLAGG